MSPQKALFRSDASVQENEESGGTDCEKKQSIEKITDSMVIAFFLALIYRGGKSAVVLYSRLQEATWYNMLDIFMCLLMGILIYQTSFWKQVVTLPKSD